MLPELVRRTAPAEINGKGYRKANTPMDFSLMRADERTIIIARDELLGKMLANVAKPEAGPAAKRFRQYRFAPDVAAVVVLDPIRPMLKAQLQKAPIPPAFANFLTIPDLIVSAEAQLSLLGGGAASLTLARQRRSRQATGIPAQRLVGHGQNRADQVQAGKFAQSQDPIQQATAKYMQPTTGRMIDRLRPVREGDHLSITEKHASLQTIAIAAAMGGFMTFQGQGAEQQGGAGD